MVIYGRTYCCPYGKNIVVKIEKEIGMIQEKDIHGFYDKG
jgi:hypothetical protein